VCSGVLLPACRGRLLVREGGGGFQFDPEAIYDLRLILNIML